MATSGFYPEKDPSDRLDYSANFTAVLETAETIASGVWTSTPAGLTLVTQEVVGAGKIARVWITGGAAGTDYTLELTATSSLASPGPRIWQRKYTLPVREL